MAHSLNPTPGDLPKSEFLTYRWVIYKAPDGRRVRGQIVGPDQEFFPSPFAVWVAYPSGVTSLTDIEFLELAEGEAEYDG